MGMAFYFGLGFVLDFLITMYTRFILQRRATWASLSGMLVTALNLWVIAEIVVSKNFILIIAFIVGQGCGTYLAVKIKP